MGLRAAVFGLVLGLWGFGAPLLCETCTTQSQMKDVDRDGLAVAARDVASRVKSNDPGGLRSQTVAELAGNFGAMQNMVAEIAPKLAGAQLVVDQVYLLDASEMKAAQGGAEGQFFCTLNKSANDVEFLIPGLTPGVYGFAVVEAVASATPWNLPMLLRKEQGRWMLAGIYPRSTQAGGHDGLWYWREARRLAGEKQPWNAWLFYGEAEALLRPANFVESTHLSKLRDEQRAAAPPALSSGIGTDVPLVVRGPDGKDYQFTGLGIDDTLAKDKVDVSARLRVDQIGDPAAARKRNEDAMRALLAAYPELRGNFHGIWVLADATSTPGQAPFATEQAMTDLH